MNLGPVIYRTREFRSVSQLIVEWLLGLLAVFTLPFSIAGLNPAGVAVGVGAVYLLYRLRVVGAWTRRRVEVYPTALRVGQKAVTWDSVLGVRMVNSKFEPGLILGDRVYSYVQVVVAEVLLKGEPTLRLRLRMEDFGAFLEYARSRMGLD